MAATYRLSGHRRLLDGVVRIRLCVERAPRHSYLLTLGGRQTGRRDSTPVTLVEEASNRWLVAPHREVAGVRNAHASGQMMLSRGCRSETTAIVELGPAEAPPVLKPYVAAVSISRPCFDAEPDCPVGPMSARAYRHAPIVRWRPGMALSP
jgi:hypothetical protein